MFTLICTLSFRLFFYVPTVNRQDTAKCYQNNTVRSRPVEKPTALRRPGRRLKFRKQIQTSRRVQNTNATKTY